MKTCNRLCDKMTELKVGKDFILVIFLLFPAKIVLYMYAINAFHCRAQKRFFKCAICYICAFEPVPDVK